MPSVVASGMSSLMISVASDMLLTWLRVLTQLVDHLFQHLVRLRAHHEVAASEDVRWNRVDPNRRRQLPVLVDHARVAVLDDRAPKRRFLEPHLAADPHEVVDVLELAAASPMRLE